MVDGREDVAVELVNCTDEDLYIAVGSGVVALATTTAPKVAAATTAADHLLVRTREGSATVTLERHGQEAVTFGAPPREHDVRYVVTPETLAQFPHREDFVAVSAYRTETAAEGGSERIVITRLTAQLAIATRDSTDFPAAPGR